MSDLNEAAKAVKNFTKMFRDVLIIGEALAEIDNLEQATLYAKDQALKSVEIRKENDKRLVESQNALNDAEGKVAAAQQESKRMLDAAYKEADAIKRTANIKADATRADAIEYELQVRESVDLEVQQRQEAKDAAVAELADLHGKISHAHTELASIKERLG